MKNFFNINHFLHNLRLSDIPRNTVEHQRIDVGLKLVRLYGRVDCLSPELDGDIVWHELAFARIFQEPFADLGARVDGAKYIAAGAMIKARNSAERFALCAFAAAGAPKRMNVLYLMGEFDFIAGPARRWEAESAAMIQRPQDRHSPGDCRDRSARCQRY